MHILHMAAHTCTQCTTVCIPLTPHAHVSYILYVHPCTYTLHTHIHTDNTNVHAQEYTLCMHTYMPTHMHTLMYTHIQTIHHMNTHTTHCVHTHMYTHTHILNAHPNIHTPIVSIYTFIHTYNAHIQATHTCTHSTPSTPYVHIHMHIHSTHTHYEHAQAHTHTRSCVPLISARWGNSAQTRSTRSFYTQLRAPVLCSPDTEGPLPLQHLFLEIPQSCSFWGPLPQSTPTSCLQRLYPGCWGRGKWGLDKNGGFFPCLRPS